MHHYKGFSDTAARLLSAAVAQAGRFGAKQADTGHLLLVMAREDCGVAGQLLMGKKVNPSVLEHNMVKNPRQPLVLLSWRAISPDLKRTMDRALIGAKASQQP